MVDRALSQADQPGRRRGVPVFTAFLAVATVALGVLCLMLARENRDLKAAMHGRRAAAAAGAAQPEPIAAGELVQRLVLVREDGSVWSLGFGRGEGDGEEEPEDRPTLVLIMAAACGYCREAIPVWDAVLSELGLAGTGDGGVVRVAAVQTDARAPGELRPLLHAAPMVLAPEPAATWLIRVPVEPAAILIDGRGVVVRTWLGLPAAADQRDLRGALIAAMAGD